MRKNLIITSHMVLEEENGESLRGRLQLIDFYRKSIWPYLDLRQRSSIKPSISQDLHALEFLSLSSLHSLQRSLSPN
jgi:hypothetical protein